MDINRSAPVQVSREVTVDAGPDAVWDLLSDVESWPRWNSDVRDAVAHGGIEPGSKFSWRSGPGRITSTFAAVERPSELGWTGHTLGIKAVHVYRLRSDGDRTTVTLEESWDGLPVRLMRRRCEHILVAAVESGLAQVQAEVARRNTGQPD